MNTLKKKPAAKPPKAAKAATAKKKKEVRAEQSLGIRIVAMIMNLLLILASASYVPTLPLTTFLFSMTAILGSYLAYIYRDNRPAWVGTIPTVATMVLFTNFFFELFTGYSSATQTAVGAFIHMLTGLLALHCFDLRSRTDFSISALIGLGLLTCLAGMAKDLVYGFYIFTYTILAGLLLFYDSSSRSHEIGPSRAVAAAAAAGPGAPGGLGAVTNVEQVVKRLRVASMAALIPVFALPFLSVLAFNSMPRIDSVIDIFKDNFVRARFPVSANLSGQLGKGGHSQSIRGGAPDSKAQGGASYTVKGGGEDGTASGARPDKEKLDSRPGDGTGHSGGISGGKDGKRGQAGLGPKSGAKDPEALKRAAMEKALKEAHERETVDLDGSASQLETVVLKVASPQPTYVRRYTLNNFDGLKWSRSYPVNPTDIANGPTDKLGFDLTASDAVYVPPNLPTLEVKQDFRIEKDNVFGHILPHSWIPQLVKIKGESEGSNKKDAREEIKIDGDGAIKLPQALNQGSSFSVTSQIPVYDFEQMRRLPPETIEQVGEERDSEIKLAKSCLARASDATSDKIEKLSLEITGAEGNWFLKADRIAEHLRKNYKYNTTSFTEKSVAETETEAKKTEGNLAEDFLFVNKQGDCRQFATAFALLCRAQGIPTRLVTGFTPGELNKTTGFYEIKGKNSHVWAEIYLPYWNWVPFDATPGGQLPAHEEGGNALSRFIRSGLANPFGQSYAASRKSKKTAGSQNGEQGKEGDKEQKKNDFWNLDTDKSKNQKMQLPVLGTVDQGTMQQILKYSVVVIATLILLVVLFVYLRQRKEAQLKDFMQTHKPSTLIFLDVLTELKRYELLKHPTETADELTLRLSDRFAELAETGAYIPEKLPGVVSQFMEIYCEDRFGGDDRLDELTQMSAHIKSLAHTKGRK